MKQKDKLTVSDVRKTLESNRVSEAQVFNQQRGIIQGYKLITRAHNSEPVKILSSRYKVVQHVDAFDSTVMDLDKEGLNYEIKKLSIVNSKNKNGVQISFAFPDIRMDVDGSPVTATLELINSNDGNLAFSRIFGAFRLVCSNGLIIGKKFWNERKPHIGTIKIERLEGIFDQISKEFEEFGILIENAQRVKLEKIKKGLDSMLIKAGFPKTIIENLPELFNSYTEMVHEEIPWGSLWAVYQYLTYWLTSVVTARSLYRSIQLNRKLYNIVQHYVTQ